MSEFDKQDTAAEEDTEPAEGQRRLYRHKKRTEWGLAMLVWEHDGKRGYQFEDGELRVFKAGFFEMLEPVDRSVEEKAELVADLQRELGRGEVKKELEAKGQQLLSFDDQLAIFRHQYPKGFQDPAWVEGIRGEGAAKRLKKHRDPAANDAATRLEQAALEQHLEQGTHDALWEATIELLENTSLVTTNQLSPLKKLSGEALAHLTSTVRELLYGDGPYAGRFDAFVGCVRGTGWELATALPALVHPQTQVCVKPSTFRSQAQWMAPGMKHPRVPDGRSYAEYLTMAQAVQTKLQEVNFKPRDLLDIYDFIWITQRPAARKALKERRRKTAESSDESSAEADQDQQAA